MDDLSIVARELRIARESIHLSREQLAERLGYSSSYIEKIETGKLAATEQYVTTAAAALAEGIDTAGLFGRLREDGLKRPVMSQWLRDWLHIEQQATELRWFEPLLIPGLLQTDPYARELLVDDDRVAARMERQSVLDGDDPPEVSVVIDESVLHRCVGNAKVMYEQLVRLTELHAWVQVLPSEADTYAGSDGAFVLATVGERQYVYVDTPARGFTLEDREVVSGMQRSWDVIRGEALPQRQSRAMILKVAESWKANSG